ncbi:unnamed protein product [Urochloa humidicola]
MASAGEPTGGVGTEAEINQELPLPSLVVDSNKEMETSPPPSTASSPTPYTYVRSCFRFPPDSPALLRLAVRGCLLRSC